MCSRRIIGLVVVSAVVFLGPSMAGAELVGCWTFNEGSGLTLNDSSGNANTGTLTNMTGSAWQAGHSGAALDYSLAFDGVNDVVIVPDSPSVSPTGDMTLAAWVNLPSWAGSAKNILAKQSNSSYRWRVNAPDGQLWALLEEGSGIELFYAGASVPTGGWHHTALTANFSDSKVRFYLDGDLVSTKTMNSTTSIQDTTGALTIGAYNTGGVEGFVGNLDDVAIFNHALSDGEIKQLATGQPVLINPSFEEDSFTAYPGYVGPSNGQITGWTSNTTNSGINPVVGGSSPFANNGTIPDGDQVAFLQRNAATTSISQTAMGFEPGETYLVTYRENARSPQIPAVGSLMMDAETLVPQHSVAYVGGSNPYHYTAGKLFTATSSAHTLKFTNHEFSADNTLLLDDVEIHRMYLKFSDDYNTLSDTSDINPNASNDEPGRQGGHFASITYAQTDASKGQIAADQLLIAGTGINKVSPNRNFNLNGLADAHFVIELEVAPGTSPGDEWAALVFGSSSQTASVNTSDGIGIHFRDTGHYAIFDGTSGTNYSVKSDTLAGTGGVFDMQIHYFVPGFDDTTPGMVDIWANGVLVHSFITDSGFANNYINLIGYSNDVMDTPHVFDNFRVYSSFVPEPGTLSLLALGGVLLLGRVRRRRK